MNYSTNHISYVSLCPLSLLLFSATVLSDPLLGYSHLCYQRISQSISTPLVLMVSYFSIYIHNRRQSTSSVACESVVNQLTPSHAWKFPILD